MVRSRIVARASDYLCSSTANYVHGNGLLEDVTLAVNPVADVLMSWSIVKNGNYLNIIRNEVMRLCGCGSFLTRL